MRGTHLEMLEKPQGRRAGLALRCRGGAQVKAGGRRPVFQGLRLQAAALHPGPAQGPRTYKEVRARWLFLDIS